MNRTVYSGFESGKQTLCYTSLQRKIYLACDLGKWQNFIWYIEQVYYLWNVLRE